MKRYCLQNRYQDSGWEHMAGEEFDFQGEAEIRACELAEDAIRCGMVRVVDTERKVVTRTYSAGHKLK